MALQNCYLIPQSSRNLKEMVVILIHCFYLLKKKKKKNSGSEERSDCEGEKGISIVLMELLFSILLKLFFFFLRRTILLKLN